MSGQPRSPFVLLVLVVLVSLYACSTANAAGKELRPVPEIYPSKDNGVTRLNLSVRLSRVAIPLAIEKGGEPRYFEYTGRFYELEDSGPLLPGPVLYVQPGGKVKLNVSNHLGEENASQSMEGHLFRLHNPNTTNVHFHGLHSNPRVDDPFKAIRPGKSHFYKLSIPRDHLPGLHWYHAHVHGSVYSQVMGGLFGAIVAEESPLAIARVHPFHDADTTVLLIHLYRLRPSLRCDGMTLSDVDAAIGTYIASDPRIVDRHGKTYELPPDLFLVNGQHQPIVPVRAHVPAVLRLGFAAGSCHLNLTLPPQCSWHVLAYDGVPLPWTRHRNWVYFTTATRAELVVLCEQEGHFPLVDAYGEVILSIDVKGGKSKAKGGSKKRSGSRLGTEGKTLPLQFPVKMPKYSPDYLHLDDGKVLYRDISFSQLSLPQATEKPYYLIGQGTDCSSLRNDSTCYYEHFMGKRGSNGDAAANNAKYRGFTVPLHSIVVVRVYGDPTDPVPHPLHFHVNHFQVLGFQPRVGGQHANHTLGMYGVRVGQYRDTIPALDGVTTIRWQAATYAGEIVYHCHALHHEDRGMMSSYLVYKQLQPPANPSSSGHQAGNHGGEGRGISNPWLRAGVVILLAAVTAIIIVGGVLYNLGIPPPSLVDLLRARTAAAGAPTAVTESEVVPLLPATVV